MERLTLYTDRSRGTIQPGVYGHFIEHLGRCIYDGLWVGPDSPIPNVDGLRLEAIEVFKAVKAPVIRWPGGYFADCYDWRDGIGPRERRPVRFHQCEPDSRETNGCGTHEFLQFCELVGAEPNLCNNTATLGPQEAMDWVEYCNADTDTHWANQRRAHGQQEPWGVKYWAIGNESYWLNKPQEYVQRYLLWRKYMQRVDPSIRCIASLIEPTWKPEPFGPMQDWLQEVLVGIRGHMELASLHLYSGVGPAQDFAPRDYYLELASIDQRNRLRIESFLGAIDSIVGSERVMLALDEWGLWRPGETMTNNAEQPCTHRDAVFTARYFHLLQEYPRRIELATVAQTINILHALLRTDGPRTYRTPAFHVFEMFKGHQGGESLALVHSTPRFAIEDEGTIVRQDRETDLVTASASKSADGRELLLSMTNGDLATSHTYEVELVGSFVPTSALVRVLAEDLAAENTYDEPEQVQPKDQPLVLEGQRLKIELPPCSVVTVAMKA